MSVDTITSDMLQFHQFVGQKIAEQQKLSPEELVDLWREEHPSPEETEATIAAVKKSLAEMEAGHKGIPAREFLAKLRADVRGREPIGGTMPLMRFWLNLKSILPGIPARWIYRT